MSKDVDAQMLKLLNNCAKGDPASIWELAGYLDVYDDRDMIPVVAMLLKISSKKGHADSMASLAFLYVHKLPKTRANSNKALYWYKKAARLNGKGAIHNLARSFETGGIVRRNLSKAKALYSKGMTSGDIDCSVGFARVSLALDRSPTNLRRLLKILKSGLGKTFGEAELELARIEAIQKGPNWKRRTHSLLEAAKKEGLREASIFQNELRSGTAKI